MTAVLTEVGEGHDVTRLVVVTAFVGYPYFDFVNRYTGCNIRCAGHGTLVVVAEEMREEEVSVLIVTVTADVKSRHLRTTFAAHRLCLAVLLGDQGLNTESAEFEIRFDTEQGSATTDKRTVQIHGHVTGLDGLDDVIFFAFVVEFQVLLVKREGGLRVVGQVEVQFLAYFSLNAGLYLLVKVEDVIVARA